MTVDGLAAGIDIGGTKTRAVAIDGAGLVVGDVRLGTDASGGHAVVTGTLRVLAELAELVGVRPAAFDVVGVGVPGLVDPVAGTVRHAVNLGFDGQAVAIGPQLTAVTGVRCVVENDVNAAALGALALVAPPGAGDLTYLSIGTGIAAGVVLRGRPWRGHRGLAGEIGHLPVDPSGPRCACGRRGCLEAVASGAAIARRWPSPRGVHPAAALFAAAAGGDPAAITVRDEVAGFLARAVELLALTFDVECIVVGGGVADVGPPLLLALQAALATTDSRSPLLEALDLSDRVGLAPVGAPLGALGAALAARSAETASKVGQRQASSTNLD